MNFNNSITNFKTAVKLGFNVVAIGNDKRPITAWKQFQRESQKEEQRQEQLKLLQQGKARTIALVCGFNNLVALDFDTVDKSSKVIPESLVKEVIAKLGVSWPYTWAWRSVSGAGWHVWITVPDLPNNETLRIIQQEKLQSIGLTDVSPVRALEIRAWGKYTVIPPNSVIPEELPSSVSWQTLREVFNLEDRQQENNNRNREYKQITHRDRQYALAALRSAVDIISKAPVGERNTKLYNQTKSLSGFVESGALSEQEIVDAVSAASTLETEREIMATVKSALSKAPDVGPRYAPNTNLSQSKDSFSIVDHVAEELLKEGYNFALNTETGEYIVTYKDEPARVLNDNDIMLLKGWAKDKKYTLNLPELALVRIANKNKFSPIRDGLLSLEWDGHSHIAKVASCLHVDDGLPQDIAEKWLTYWLLKAVGRVFAKEQNIVLVLEGGQGLGKSHFVQWLGSVIEDGYIEESIEPHSKDCLLNLTKKLVWEICELDAVTRKHDAAALKHFITRSTITVRPPYGKTAVTHPVLASLIATTNGSSIGYLTDETGNRRFLILPLKSIDWNYTETDPKQVWAEAVARWKSGERGILLPEDITLRETIASDRLVISLADDWLQKYLEITRNEHDVLSSSDIITFLKDQDIALGGTERSQAIAIGQAMSKLRIPKERRLLSNGTRLRVWVGVRLNDTKSQFVISKNNNDDNPPDDTPPEPKPTPPTSSSGGNDGGNGGETLNIEEIATWEDTAVHVIETNDDVKTMLNDVMKQSAIGLDIETTGLDPRGHKIRLIQLATPREVYILDAYKTNVQLLKPLFESEHGPVLTGHNLKFDLAFLRRAGIDSPSGARLFDTMLAAKLLSAGEADARHGLGFVVSRYLNETISKELQKSDWSGELTDAQLEYAARDAHILLPLRNALMRELINAKLTTVAAIENRALPAIVWMEDYGVLINQQAWKEHADTLASELADIEKELVATTGKMINWRSVQQVLNLLRERGHDIDTTDYDTLKHLAATDSLVKLLLHHREVSKKYAAFGHAFLEFVNFDGRIHPDFDQIGAVSGRMTCRKPNMQQIPRDPVYRSMFVAPDGRILIKADYSQIELRIAAEITNDERMLEAYKLGEDLHTLTAKLVLGKKEVTKNDRQAAKALNFGLIYGMGAVRLKSYAANSYGVQLTDDEAVAFRNKFFNTYRGIKRWHNQHRNEDIEETRTLANRRRLNVEKFQEKLNTPVQGTGADGLKAALGLMWDTRILRSSAVPILAVHDEIVVECDEEDAEKVKDWVVECMVKGMEQFLKNVPVEVEAVITKTWGGK